jgi:hypothetical protein
MLIRGQLKSLPKKIYLRGRRRIITLFIALYFFACNTADNKTDNPENDTTGFSAKTVQDISSTHNNADTQRVNTSTRLCMAGDFLKLKNKQLQADFFIQLDSVRKIQYQDSHQDIYNLVDITPAILNKFLNDINIDSLTTNGSYEAKFFFNISPKGYTDSKICDDLIIIRFFNEDCGFRMIIDNVYPVEEQGCAGGAQVIYGFKIINNKIVDFGRQAAG